KLLYITYEESTLLRRSRVRCCDSLELDVVEHSVMISQNALELGARKRLTMENSTNKFNHLGPDPNNKDEEWNLPVQEKRELLGDTRRESGGASSVPPELAEKGKAQRAATDLEPVSFHGNTAKFWEEIYHSYWAASILDMTPQNDNAALAAIMLKKKYLAIVNTQAHATLLRERLQERVFRLMRDPQCTRLYEPMAVADLDFLNANADESKIEKGKKVGKAKKKAKSGDGTSKGGDDGANTGGDGASKGGGKKAGRKGGKGKGGNTGGGEGNGEGAEGGKKPPQSLAELLVQVQNSAKQGGEGEAPPPSG
ncbi:unnamed protein product, partial [Symbiodinium necroappetens]